MITKESSWGGICFDEVRSRAPGLVLLHLVVRKNNGNSIIQVLTTALSIAYAIDKSPSNTGGHGATIQKPDSFQKVQRRLCDVIVRAFSSITNHKYSSTAVTSAFEEFTRCVLPLPMLSEQSSATRINLMTHLIHPLFQIPNMWRSCKIFEGC